MHSSSQQNDKKVNLNRILKDEQGLQKYKLFRKIRSATKEVSKWNIIFFRMNLASR
jgi:hypothetical protein